MFFATHLIGFGAGGGIATRSFVAVTDNTANLTTYTFSAHSLGTAAGDRKIVVAAMGTGGSPGGVSSLTVAGVSAASVIEATNGAQTVSMWIADVPTGATGDIVVTFAAGKNRCGIAVYALYGAGSSTAFDTGSATADPYSDTLNVPANGVAIAAAADTNNTTATWTGLTEDSDTAIESTYHGCASAEFTASQSAMTVTCDVAATTAGAMVCASWGP